MVTILPDETLDDLIIGNLKLLQKREGFRFNMDSVLLAHFATVKTGDRIVDLGTGTGVIPLLLSTRLKKGQIVGLEIQPEMAEMAGRSVEMNGLQGLVQIMQGDLRETKKKLPGGTYTLVTANPPYGTLGEGLLNPFWGKALARHEVSCSLEDVIACAGNLLNYQGRFAMIHRVERLLGIIDLLKRYRLEPRRLRFIHPLPNKPAGHVLLEARKQGAPDMKVLPPLFVYERAGKYSTEIMNWYQRGDEMGGKT